MAAAQRRLRAALAAVLVSSTAPELELVHRWLDSWRGVGQIAEGMHRAGWDLQLTEYGDGHWRATFFVTLQGHSVVGGSAWGRAPWRAGQRGAGGGRIRKWRRLTLSPQTDFFFGRIPRLPTRPNFHGLV